MENSKLQIWDKEKSTWRRDMLFADGSSMTGYSMQKDRNERRDKIDLLTNWILRDLVGGYLDRKSSKAINPTIRIDYFMNRTQEHFLSLSYFSPDWTQKSAENEKLRKWMTRFYAMLRAGKSPQEIEDALKIRSRERNYDELDFMRPGRFLSLAELEFYYMGLLEQKRHTEEAIHHFYREYKAKWFSVHQSALKINNQN